MTTLARVKRNGARNRMEMVHEFIGQSDIFRFMSIGQCVETLRSYERDGLLVITADELILNHSF